MAESSNVGPGVWFIGQRISHKFYCVDPDTGLPQSLTGKALRYTLRVDADTAGSALISKTTGAGEITFETSTAGTAAGVADDVAIIAIAPSDTSALTEGTYHDALVQTTSGQEYALGYGAVFLSKIAS